jgi:hypothetical protein
MKKMIALTLALVMTLSLLACCGVGGSGNDGGGKSGSEKTSALEQTDVVVELIKLGNELAESGEDEAAKTVFESAAAALRQRGENPDYIMPDYRELVSEKSAELATCLAVSEVMGNSKESADTPKIDFDWGN